VATLTRRLILASQSPRRREILERLRLPFEVLASGVDENILEAQSPSDFAAKAAEAKSRDVASRITNSCLVLGSDTVVAIGGEALGKPVNRQQSAQMIQRLAGGWHEVFTGVCLVDNDSGAEKSAVGRTRVLFRHLTPDEITRYVATGEGDDKAGAYGIQGIGSGLVERIDGPYDNVVGLPATLVLQLLREMGCLLDWP